jgi:uncharacterized radical SAM superfamily Fe-S cluster-containing enzyme
MAEFYKTKVFCEDCNTVHPARQKQVDGKIVGEVDCPIRSWETTLSENAELFMQFRKKAQYDHEMSIPRERPYYFHYLSVTDECNSHCPVCFTATGEVVTKESLAIEDARLVARNAKANNVSTIVFIGGEPTVHPNLFKLIEIFRQSGFKVWIATNGLEIARRPRLAQELKDAGVSKLCLQFDSFDEQEHFAIRGHTRIDEKLKAARAIADAGLILGLVCTVTSHNLEGLSSFCQKALSWENPPHTIAIQGAAHSGRLETDKEKHVTREDIIDSLVKGQAIPGLTNNDFWPIPVLRPLNIYVHPDCAGNTMAILTGSRVEPISKYLNLDKLLGLAFQSPSFSSSVRRNLHLFKILLKSLRPSGFLLPLKHLGGRVLGNSGVRIMLIGTGSFMRRDFLDMERVNRCASGALTTSECESLCHFYSKKPMASCDITNSKEVV